MKARPEDFDIQPLTAQREWAVEGIPVLSATVELPVPKSADRRHWPRLRQYYQLQSRAYLRYCAHWLLPQAEAEYRLALANSTPLPHFRAELTYQVTYRDGHLWSLYTQSREQTLPGQLLLTRRADTWDLSTGYPVPLRDFFSRRAPWRRQLLAFAAEEIRRQERSGTAQYREDWRKRLRRSFNPENYYLTPEGLVFFFPMYAIAPAIERIPTFLLPYGTGALQSLSVPLPEQEKDTAP